jgi:hypothetical protein
MDFFNTAVSVLFHKGEFTLANFARDFALSLHVLLKNFITKCASLVRNRTLNCASVNAPLVEASVAKTKKSFVTLTPG